MPAPAEAWSQLSVPFRADPSVLGLIFRLTVQNWISHRNPQVLQKRRAASCRAWSLRADLYHLPDVGQQHQDNLHLFPVAMGWHSQSSINLPASLCVWGLNSRGRSTESSACDAWCAAREPLRGCVPGGEVEWHLQCLLTHFRYPSPPSSSRKAVIHSTYTFFWKDSVYACVMHPSVLLSVSIRALEAKARATENQILTQSTVPLLKWVQLLACR